MTPLATFLTWLGLLALVGVEFLLHSFAATRGVVPFVGLGMALLVALTFMRLGASGGLVPVFALAGVFWLCIMLGLGSLDSFTRHDIPVSMHTEPD